MVASVISELIKVIYRFFFANYQQNVEGKKMKGSDSIFDYLDKIHYSCYKIYIYRLMDQIVVDHIMILQNG